MTAVREPAGTAGGKNSGEPRFYRLHNIPPGIELKKQAARLSPLRRPATFRHRLAAAVALSAFRHQLESTAPAY